ncbi:TPA: XRE family transcriptional regulator, partial [Streptococcus pyogenes]
IKLKELSKAKGGGGMTKKQRLKQEHLKPKKRLREERLKREYTEMYMADLIGLKNRKGYSEKEDGLQPFKDYEMAIISQKFNVSESELFF